MTTNENETKEGWGLPQQSRKWHYFVDTRSLCGHWGFYTGPLNQRHASKANCARCSQRLAKRRKKL